MGEGEDRVVVVGGGGGWWFKTSVSRDKLEILARWLVKKGSVKNGASPKKYADIRWSVL